MSSGGFTCFGATCRAEEEFCDELSRFCISCSAKPWKNYCFTSDHIVNCTTYCKALEMENRPPNELEKPEEYQYHFWPFVVIGVILLVCVAVCVLLVYRRRRCFIRLKKSVLPCLTDQNRANDTTPEPADNLGDETEEMLRLSEVPCDPHPVQVTEEETTGQKSNDYPKFGPTVIENHTETKLLCT